MSTKMNLEEDLDSVAMQIVSGDYSAPRIWNRAVRLDLAYAVFLLANKRLQGKLVRVFEHATPERLYMMQEPFQRMFNAPTYTEFQEAAEEYYFWMWGLYFAWVTETPEGAKFEARQEAKRNPDTNKKKLRRPSKKRLKRR